MKVFQWLSMICFMAMFAAVGGVEQGSFSLATGIVLAITDLGLTVFFAYCGGMFYGQ